MFRPAPMTWVDLLVDRDAVPDALDLIGSLRIIEIHPPEPAGPTANLPLAPDQETIARLTALERLVQPLSDAAPAPNPSGLTAAEISQPTELVLPQLEQRLRAWHGAARPHVERLKSMDTRLEELDLLAACLSALPEGEFEFGRLPWGAPSRAYPGFIAFGEDADPRALESARGQGIIRTYPMTNAGGRGGLAVVGICSSDRLPHLERALHAGRWRFVRIPDELRGSTVNALERCRQCIDSEAERRERTVNLLDELNVRSRVAALRWLLERHLWLTRTLADARRGERFVWLSGWVPQARLSELSRGLDARGIPFLLNTASPGVHGRPPVQLENPAWVRQFEPFVRGFGVPESDEVDPSPVLAISTPLMFGYMFGDVGHGIVLILLGIWLRRRVPVLGLLVPAGVSSALFGLLFGSVFCDEHVLTPLWTSPLQQPLLILVVPLAFGALLILLSLLFDAMQAFWQDRGEDWWLRRLPVVLAYCGLIAAPLDHRGVALSAVAIVWSIGWETQRGARTSGFPGLLTAPLKAGIELLETLMQLLINTLSFTRLGAFALAHAGLGTAVVILGAMPDNPWFKWAILIAGNVLVVALEGLVVSIQTTRLVMFEFFRRFLLGHGRPFQPLTAPGSAGAARAPRGAPH